METLVLDGKTFTKASKAARDLGYTSDYVGQLCRGGKVPAHLVGRTWYVDVSHLGEHRVEKKRMSRVKAREQAHKSIEEHKLRIRQTADIETPVRAVRYEEDQSELIPTVRKLEISQVKTREAPKHIVEEPAEPFVLENEGEKIVMSGTLNVIDLAEDTGVDDDTVLLQPRMIRKSHRKVPEPELQSEQEQEQEPEQGVAEEIAVTAEPISQPVAVTDATRGITFADRIKHLQENTPEAEEVPVEEGNDEMVSTTMPVEKKKSYLGIMLFLLLVLIGTTLSVGLRAEWVLVNQTDAGGSVTIESGFGYDIKEAVQKILEKI